MRVCPACRSGDLCTRYVRADLPLLDLSSKAGLDSVLGIGIALIALALLLMCIMAVVLLRMRKKTSRKRGKKGCGLAPDHCPRENALDHGTALASQHIALASPTPETSPGFHSIYSGPW